MSPRRSPLSQGGILAEATNKLLKMKKNARCYILGKNKFYKFQLSCFAAVILENLITLTSSDLQHTCNVAIQYLDQILLKKKNFQIL